MTGTGLDAAGASRRAHVGDELGVRGTEAGVVVARDGGIVGLHPPDGSPPCDVRRLGNGRVTPYLPGPDGYVRHLATGGDDDPAR
ncbi:DUF1918 domain-containing protein [Streptomyces sp. NPDC015220]|uniref:DUF1918 domain-containing protein n=1 Tax=Streptomyces sp. NPDC015220 TaxID=3364947 RepID=UPI0036FFA1DA